MNLVPARPDASESTPSPADRIMCVWMNGSSWAGVFAAAARSKAVSHADRRSRSNRPASVKCSAVFFRKSLDLCPETCTQRVGGPKRTEDRGISLGHQFETRFAVSSWWTEISIAAASSHPHLTGKLRGYLSRPSPRRGRPPPN